MRRDLPGRLDNPRQGHDPCQRHDPCQGHDPWRRHDTGQGANGSHPRCPAGRRGGADTGRALIEVVFAAVLLLIPTVYILIGVLRVQAATLAVAQAARDAGRLVETAVRPPTVDQVTAVATVALADQHVPADTLRIVTVAPGGDCATADAAEFVREPGLDYDLCVIAVIDLPGVPTVLTGDANTVTGVYTVHIDPIREGNPAVGP